MENKNLKVYYQEDEVDVTQNREDIVEQLMNLYMEKVYLLAYSFVKDQGLAEDISQEVFFKCYKSLENFRGDASLKSWIYRITVNTSMDFLRKNKTKPLFVGESFLENLKKGESSEAAVLRQDQNEQLLQAVLGLPIKYREVILLHYFLDQQITEISTTLSISPNTVKTRLKRGREKLRKILEKKERR